MFVNSFMLTESQKRDVGEMMGKITTWILEGRSDLYMAEQLNLDIWKVNRNIDETLYVYMRQVGRWRFFKTLFRRR